ncbi:ERAP1-like C-terminal domain-containing protein, partial [Rhodococcus sp. HNM0569]|uniref:ERAP1-like C-terminal domain-containing protein n=1 Tax=Rhodococcus sp. HNM0569 TaxID=2716340 RepID=UPI0016BA4406
RWALLTALAATGHVDLGELDAERARDDTGAGAIAHERASAARPLDAVKIAAWTSIFDDPQLSNDRIGALIGGFTTGARAPRGEEFADRYFAALLTTWSERSIEIARRIVVGLFPRTEDTRAVDSWLAAADDAPAALRRLVVEQRDFLRRDLDARRFDAEEAQR